MISRHHDVAPGSGVSDETESEGGDGVLGVAEGPIELMRLLVPRSHLEVDLRASTVEEEFTSGSHELGRDAATLMVGVARQIVDPTAVPVVSDHHRTDDLVILGENEESPRRVGDLPSDVAEWIVGGVHESGRSPEIDHGVGVSFGEGPDLDPLTVPESVFRGRPRIGSDF